MVEKMLRSDFLQVHQWYLVW